MEMKKVTLDDAIKAHGQAREPDQHPSATELEDYLDDLLSEQEIDEIRTHLTWCRACVATLDELGSDLDFEVDPKLKALPAAISRVGETSAGSRGRLLQVLPWFLAAAASLLLVLQNRTPEMQGAVLKNLMPISSTRGSEEVVTGGGASQRLVLTLNVILESSYEDYAAEITNAAGKVIRRKEGLEEDGNGSFSMVTSPPQKAGRYRVRLLGRQEANWRELETYAFRMEAGSK